MASHCDARLGRGLAVGAAATSLALLAHLNGGGHLPGVPWTVLFASVVIAGSVQGSKCRWTFMRLLAVMTAAQACFHLVGSLGGMHNEAANTSLYVMTAAHLLCAVVLSIAVAKADEWLLNARAAVQSLVDEVSKTRSFSINTFVWLGVESHACGHKSPLFIRRPVRGPPAS